MVVKQSDEWGLEFDGVVRCLTEDRRNIPLLLYVLVVLIIFGIKTALVRFDGGDYGVSELLGI